jgi:hypothetical protein
LSSIEAQLDLAGHCCAVRIPVMEQCLARTQPARIRSESFPMGILLVLTKTTLEGTRIVLAPVKQQKPQQTRTEAACTDHCKVRGLVSSFTSAF